MKTKFNSLYAFILVVVLSGCSKKTVLPDEEKLDGKIRVAFTVDGFEQDLVPFPKPQLASAEKGLFSETSGSDTTDLRDHINVLDIYVFSLNAAIDHVQQFADDPQFGTYETYLDLDLYKSTMLYVIFHGTKLEEGESVEWTQVREVITIGGRILPGPKNAYSAAKQFRVTEPEAISSVKLSRYIGRLDLSLEEVIPENAGHIEVSIENTAMYFNPFLGEGFHETRGAKDTPYNTIERISVLPEHKASESLSASIYFVPKEKKGSAPSAVRVHIAAYDESGSLIRETSLSDVLIQGNKVTKLKGTIFTIPNLRQEVGVDDRWDGEFPEQNF